MSNQAYAELRYAHNKCFAWMAQATFFNQYLKLHAVGVHNRFLPSSHLINYGRAVSALWHYPLPRAEAMRYLSPINHPQALKTQEQVQASFAKVWALGLPAHKGKEKNWDFLAAFSLILGCGQLDDCIVDLGCGTTSVILEWLHLYGYTKLHACDLVVQPHQTGHINYTRQNLEHTSYPDHSADVVTCLSVIEHGVNITALLRECRRLLKPGGCSLFLLIIGANP